MPDQPKFLGEFEHLILLCVIKLGDAAYGVTIRELLSSAVNRDVTVGALYTTLERLENKGMLASRMGEASAQRGGRAKKFFKVTAQGQAALLRSKQALDNLWQDVSLGRVDV